MCTKSPGGFLNQDKLSSIFGFKKFNIPWEGGHKRISGSSGVLFLEECDDGVFVLSFLRAILISFSGGDTRGKRSPFFRAYLVFSSHRILLLPFYSSKSQIKQGELLNFYESIMVP